MSRQPCPPDRIVLGKGEDDHVAVHMPQDERDFERIVNKVKDEASDCRDRWGHLYDFKASMARIRSVYAMTVHCSQGGTFGWVFADTPDIRKRQRDNVLEAQQLYILP